MIHSVQPHGGHLLQSRFPMVPLEEFDNLAAVTQSTHILTFSRSRHHQSWPFWRASFWASNQLTVESVCYSLRSRFLATCAHASRGISFSLGTTLTAQSKHKPRTRISRSSNWQRSCCQAILGRFGPDLLPGMYCSPIHTVPPKPGTDLLRLINDQSDGEFSPKRGHRDDIYAGHAWYGIISRCSRFARILVRLVVDQS